jgi:FkbM family methyltransferase
MSWSTVRWPPERWFVRKNGPMYRERVKRALRPIIQPLLNELQSRLKEQVDSSLAPIRAELAAMRSDVWHAKLVPLGDQLLVGCRHLDLVFLVEADDRLIVPRFVMDAEYEPETTAFLKKNVGMTSVCIDVGANFGYFTCLMAKLAWQGRTLSFEADPEVYELLQQNIHINWCERVVEGHNLAVGQSEGKLTLFRRIGRSGNTSIIQATSEELGLLHEPPSQEFVIDCVALDPYAEQLPRVDVVKIDVEGAESLVLAGMRQLIALHRPVIVMEWSPWQTERAGFSVEELATSIDGMGLVPHTIDHYGEATEISARELVGLPYQNIVLKHRSSTGAG